MPSFGPAKEAKNRQIEYVDVILDGKESVIDSTLTAFKACAACEGSERTDGRTNDTPSPYHLIRPY